MYGVDFPAGTYSDVVWSHVRASGRTFAFLQACDGMYPVPAFSSAWAGLRTVGMLRGAWHTLREESAVEQAVLFLKLVDLERGDLPPVLDLGALDNGTPSLAIEAASTWISVVESELEARHGAPGPCTIIRSGSRLFGTRRDPPELGKHPLWLVDHERFDDPVPPGLWERGDWFVHQYSRPTRGLPGAVAAVHLDRFNPLKLFDRGNRVTWLKRQMRELGYGFGVTESDELDAATEAAVTRFQNARGLLEDGIVGPKTYAELHWTRS